MILLDLIRSFDVSFGTDEVTNIQIFSRVRIRRPCGHMMACHNNTNQTGLPIVCVNGSTTHFVPQKCESSLANMAFYLETRYIPDLNASK